MKTGQISKPREEPTAEFMRELSRSGDTRAYNITVGKEPRFIWYRNAKVATQTTFHTLDHANVIYQVHSGYELNYIPSDLDRDFKFGFVRNPWDRLVSGWLNKIVRPTTKGPDWFNHLDKDLESLVDYLETKDVANCNIHFRLQTCLVPAERLDFLGRYETFEADLGHIVTQLALERPTAFAEKNASKSRTHYRDYYTPELKDRVATLYRDDIEAFSYDF